MPESLSPSWIWGLYFGTFLIYLIRRSFRKNFKIIFIRQDPIVYTDEKTIKYMEENWWTQVKQELKIATFCFLLKSFCMLITISWDVLVGFWFYFLFLIWFIILGFLATFLIPPTVIFNIFTVNLLFISTPFFVVNFIEDVEKGSIKTQGNNM